MAAYPPGTVDQMSVPGATTSSVLPRLDQLARGPSSLNAPTEITPGRAAG